MQQKMENWRDEEGIRIGGEHLLGDPVIQTEHPPFLGWAWQCPSGYLKP